MGVQCAYCKRNVTVRISLHGNKSHRNTNNSDYAVGPYAAGNGDLSAASNLRQAQYVIARRLCCDVSQNGSRQALLALRRRNEGREHSGREGRKEGKKRQKIVSLNEGG